MKFLQTRQKVHSSFRIVLCTCQIWSYKTKLFWSYLSMKKRPLNNFLRRKLFIIFQKKKKKIPWTKIKYGKFQAKMQISEHYGSKYEQWFKLKDILGGSSTGSKVRAEFCLHHGSDVQTTVHWFSQNEQIFLKFGILYLCSTAFLGSLVKSCKGRGWLFCLFFVF